MYLIREEDVKGIKNPIRSLPNYRHRFSEIYDAQAQYFDKGKQAVLSKAKKVDLDEVFSSYMTRCQRCPYLGERERKLCENPECEILNKTFTQFLEEERK